VFYFVYYVCWITQVEKVAASSVSEANREWGLLAVLLFFNTLFAVKELVQSQFGQHNAYFRSMWNLFDILSFIGVYLYACDIMFGIFAQEGHIPLSVVTSIFLTLKLLSYLRGFGSTGWLIAVLIANFQDVRGFLIILVAMLVGFSVSFRALFAATGDESFGSLKRAFLSTFELTLTGTYDTALLVSAEYTILSSIIFILAITCVLVVALNALISILGDSYARVQKNAIANRRRERAALIVEYMILLPEWKRKSVEENAKWFHSLMEVDADGALLDETDDWVGGLNALKSDMEMYQKALADNHQRALLTLKEEVEGEIQSFRKEMISLLGQLSTDIKVLKKRQAEGGITFSGRNVAKAVQAVKSVQEQGAALFGIKEE